MPTPDESSFVSRLSPTSLALMAASGSTLVRQLGRDAVREVVFGILIGKNLRDSTEILTRRRIAALNRTSGTKKAEKWLAQWLVGLTGKSIQNVLRDNPTLLVQ